jgi:hypothetical protein
MFELAETIRFFSQQLATASIQSGTATPFFGYETRPGTVMMHTGIGVLMETVGPRTQVAKI